MLLVLTSVIQKHPLWGSVSADARKQTLARDESEMSKKKKKEIPFFHVRHNFGKFCSIRSAGSSLAASLKPQSAAELLLLLPSAVTSSINTSDPVPLAATAALRLTDDPSVSRGARTADV